MLNELLDLIFRWVGYLGPSPYLRGLAVVLLFLLLASVTQFITRSTLRRLFQRLTGTGGTGAAFAVGQRTVFRTIVLVGLMIATTTIELTPRAETIILAVIKSLLILVWAGAGIRGGGFILAAVSRQASPPPWARATTAPLVSNLIGVVLVLAGAYAILVAWDVNVTGLVASAGIVGLALSFAAQDTLGNLFAGVAILADQPYRIGDYIVLDSGERGQVTHIGLRSTRLLTRDDEEVSIPNGIMGKAKIVNESGGPHVKYRLRVRIGVAYGSDIDKVMATLIQIAARYPDVCQDPAPRVRFRTFGESSLDFELLAWIAEPSLRGLALHELNCEIYRTFAREGIVIPFPQRDVHVRDWRQPS